MGGYPQHFRMDGALILSGQHVLHADKRPAARLWGTTTDDPRAADSPGRLTAAEAISPKLSAIPLGLVFTYTDTRSWAVS